MICYARFLFYANNHALLLNSFVAAMTTPKSTPATGQMIQDWSQRSVTKL